MPLAIGALLAGALWTLRSSSSTPSVSTDQPAALAVVRSLRVNVQREIPHDTDAFTQGLVFEDGVLFESTGLRGESDLRRVDPATGDVQAIVTIDEPYFAEGLALVDDRLILITLDEEEAFVFDPSTLERVGTFEYEGSGWGLCYDGERLVMTDGGDRLTFRDPETFAPLGGVQVRLRGQPLRELNELECVDGAVYANVWGEEYLVRVDPETGRVTHQIDASGLLAPDERSGTDVLNGIAWNPRTETFYVTGKWWPTMFEVTFDE